MRRLALLVCLIGAPASAQIAEICTNDADDDRDGRADCEDADCADQAGCEGRALPSENTPRLCQNGTDDDGDGRADCDDEGCARLIFCASRRPPEIEIDCTLAESANVAECGTRQQIYQPRVIEDRPEARFLAHEDARRYPQEYVRQPMTMLQGMLAPGVSFAIEPTGLAYAQTATRLGLGVSYGVLDDLQIDVVAVPVQLSPSAEYFDPWIGGALRILHEGPVELAIGASVAIPVRSGTSVREPLPTTYALGRARDASVAAIDLDAPMRFHLGDVARLDVSAIVVSIVASDPVVVDLSWPLALAFQITEYAFAGVTSAVAIAGPSYDRPTVALGLLVGTTIPAFRRGPIAQIAFAFGWPALFDPSQIDPVVEQAWRIGIDARLLSYLLP